MSSHCLVLWDELRLKDCGVQKAAVSLHRKGLCGSVEQQSQSSRPECLGSTWEVFRIGAYCLLPSILCNSLHIASFRFLSQDDNIVSVVS